MDDNVFEDYQKPIERYMRTSESYRTNKKTIQEWSVSNAIREKQARYQQELADRVLRECDRIRAATSEATVRAKTHTDRRIEKRIRDVEFKAKELNVQREQVCRELEELQVCKMRLEDCLETVQKNGLELCKKCILIRNGRVGIDVVADDVDDKLQREITTILGAQALLRKSLEQLMEQMRLARASRYALDGDLKHKETALEMDTNALNLTSTDNCLKACEGNITLEPANISYEEWKCYSAKKIEQTAEELACSRSLRVIIDTLMRQVTEDPWEAYDSCNKAFIKRIEETKVAKRKLEDLHSVTVHKVKAMQDSIVLLEKALLDKKPYAYLNHTRRELRRLRPGVEMVRDSATVSMEREADLLRQGCEALQQKLAEARDSARGLLQMQVQLEEDIKIKMNSLKVDEVECMTVRASMDYHHY